MRFGSGATAAVRTNRETRHLVMITKFGIPEERDANLSLHSVTTSGEDRSRDIELYCLWVQVQQCDQAANTTGSADPS